MKNKTQEIIECSRWLFPAVILSGWLSPVIFALSWLWEVLKQWL